MWAVAAVGASVEVFSLVLFYPAVHEAEAEVEVTLHWQEVALQ